MGGLMLSPRNLGLRSIMLDMSCGCLSCASPVSQRRRIIVEEAHQLFNGPEHIRVVVDMGGHGVPNRRLSAIASTDYIPFVF